MPPFRKKPASGGYPVIRRPRRPYVCGTASQKRQYGAYYRTLPPQSFTARIPYFSDGISKHARISIRYNRAGHFFSGSRHVSLQPLRSRHPRQNEVPASFFCPCDWFVDVCAGILWSLLDVDRFCYSKWSAAALLVDCLVCFAVALLLCTGNPQMFRFLMDFAATTTCASSTAKPCSKNANRADKTTLPTNTSCWHRQSKKNTPPSCHRNRPPGRILRFARNRRGRHRHRLCSLERFAFRPDRHQPLYRTDQQSPTPPRLPPAGYF